MEFYLSKETIVKSKFRLLKVEVSSPEGTSASFEPILKALLPLSLRVDRPV